MPATRPSSSPTKQSTCLPAGLAAPPPTGRKSPCRPGSPQCTAWQEKRAHGSEPPVLPTGRAWLGANCSAPSTPAGLEAWAGWLSAQGWALAPCQNMCAAAALPQPRTCSSVFSSMETARRTLFSAPEWLRALGPASRDRSAERSGSGTQANGHTNLGALCETNRRQTASAAKTLELAHRGSPVTTGTSSSRSVCTHSSGGRCSCSLAPSARLHNGRQCRLVAVGKQRDKYAHIRALQLRAAHAITICSWRS